MKHSQTLSLLFSFPGFRARRQRQGNVGDPHARLVVFVRRKKQPCAPSVGPCTAPSMPARQAGCRIPMPRAGVCIWPLSNGA